MKEIACTPMAENWGNDEACLCIHGFSSAPGIYRTLTDIAGRPTATSTRRCSAATAASLRICGA